MSIALFPTDRAAPAPRSVAPDSAALEMLRRCARRCLITRRLDLERLCADPEAGDAEFWGIALMQAACRTRRLDFHRGADAEATQTECWMAGLITALDQGDDESARFIAERHLSQSNRRFALCFAQRLLAARRIATNTEPGPTSAECA
jgi:hypothetical protein